MKHLDKNYLLTPFQHGFWAKHSCASQLLSFTQEIYDKLEAEKQTDLIVMDFSKVIKWTTNYLYINSWNLVLTIILIFGFNHFSKIVAKQLL